MKSIELRKILVPMDFSRNSVKALKLATSIAVCHNASIHLLHVADNDYDLNTSVLWPEPLRFTETTRRLGVFAKSVIDQHNLKCFYTSEYGSVTHSILKSAIDIHADLIILGKNGSNGMVPDYAGTHCCQVAEKSGIPVLIVPEQIEKFNIESVLFPVRPLLSVTDKYDAIRSLFISKPAFTVLNLRDPGNESELHIIHKISQLMEARFEQDMIPYKMEYYFKDSQFAEKVLSTLHTKAFDLAIVSSEAGESKENFQIGHYVQKIIHNVSIPLLVLHSQRPAMTADEVLNKLETEYASYKS